jgi:hypothetical protein
MFGYARLSTPYSGRLTATGTEPIKFSIISGSLPPGLSLNENTGIISGAALSSGTYTFEVVASNLAGDSQPKQFTINSGNALAIITTSPLPPGTVGVPYPSFKFEAAGLDYSWEDIQGVEVETWFPELEPGHLPPPGLQLLSSGMFQGTPTQAGVYNFRVRVVNGPLSANPPSPETISPFTIEIGTPPTITTPTSLMGGVYRPFTITLQATGPQPITFEMVGTPPPYPADIKVESNGALSWLVPVEGTYVFDVVATNVFGTSQPVRFTLTITTPSIIDRQEDLDIGVVGEAYEYTFSAGGVGPFTWSLTGGLPNGLSFDAETATISGIPEMVGETPFHLRVTNAGGFAEEDFTLIVYERPLFITTAARSGNVGSSYSQPLLTSGTTPITLEMVIGSGNLPPGLNLGLTGISGSPTATGTYTFTLRAQNILGLDYADEREFTITILPSNAPVITTDNKIFGIKGKQLDAVTLEATGATPIVFAVADILPDGLELNFDSVTGIYTIEGTPTIPGTHEFTISATNGDGTDYRTFTLTVGDPPIITSTALPDGFTEVAYFEQLTATGDAPIYWELLQPIGSETGLPTGLSLNPRNGVISGVPTSGGEFSFRVEAENNYGSDIQPFTIKIEQSGGTFINGDEIANLFINGDEVSEAYVNGLLIYKHV